MTKKDKIKRGGKKPTELSIEDCTEIQFQQNGKFQNKNHCAAQAEQLSKATQGSLSVFMMKRKPSHTAQQMFWYRDLAEICQS